MARAGMAGFASGIGGGLNQSVGSGWWNPERGVYFMWPPLLLNLPITNS
jgi:hypothetical protein